MTSANAEPGASGPQEIGAVALAAVLVYGLLVPGAPPLTQRDVNQTVASALASVTPAPAFSELVYRAVEPSVVLIQTKASGGTGTPASCARTPGGGSSSSRSASRGRSARS